MVRERLIVDGLVTQLTQGRPSTVLPRVIGSSRLDLQGKPLVVEHPWRLVCLAVYPELQNIEGLEMLRPVEGARTEIRRSETT